MARRKQHTGTKVLERGNIYFMYRPKVQRETVRGLQDVQRFYFILSPSHKKVYRLITVGQKEMPEIEEGQRNWGFVSKVGHRAEEMEDELHEEKYGTKTRGERVRPAVRPAGEGVYAIVRHGDHTHLAYVLEIPKRAERVQKDLNIEEEGSYIISVKNPDTPAPRGAGLRGEQKADFPEELRKAFRGRRFADADPPDFLDYEGAEIMLIGAKGDAMRGLGIDLNPEVETEATAEIFRDLHLERDQHPTAPLFAGKWE